MSQRLLRLTFVGILCITPTLLAWGMAVAAAAPATPDFSSVRKHIETLVASGTLPSVSIAVSRDGTLLWEESFGLADRENDIKATPHTPYYLASITKSLTATAVMLLRDRKQITLDSPLNDYLGAAKLSSPAWDVDQATVRRVLTHTAGLTTYDRTCYSDETDCRISDDLTITRYGILFWPPGDHFDYSNLDYGLIGEAVARISGRTLSDFLDREIFRPLGMTGCYLGHTNQGSRVPAVAYSAARGRTEGFSSSTPGASGAYCSADDLVRFGMFALKQRGSRAKALLSDSSIDEMLRTAIMMPDSQGYSLGWWTNDDMYGYRGVLAQGGTDVAQASLQLVPSEGIAVAVVSNTGSPYLQALVDQVLSQLLPKYAERLAAASGKQSAPYTNPPSYLLVGKWRGAIHTYKGDVPLTLDISDTGAVSAALGGRPAAPMAPARFKEYRLVGRMPGTLNTVEDTGPYPYDLYIELYLRDGMLEGAVTTTAKPEARYSNELSYWVRLKKD